MIDLNVTRHRFISVRILFRYIIKSNLMDCNLEPLPRINLTIELDYLQVVKR